LVGQRALGWPALLLRGRRRAQDGPDWCRRGHPRVLDRRPAPWAARGLPWAAARGAALRVEDGPRSRRSPRAGRRRLDRRPPAPARGHV